MHIKLKKTEIKITKLTLRSREFTAFILNTQFRQPEIKWIFPFFFFIIVHCHTKSYNQRQTPDVDNKSYNLSFLFVSKVNWTHSFQYLILSFLSIELRFFLRFEAPLLSIVSFTQSQVYPLYCLKLNNIALCKNF